MSAQQLVETLAPFVETFSGERREGAVAMLALARVCAAGLAAEPPQDDPQPDEREVLVEVVARAQAPNWWGEAGPIEDNAISDDDYVVADAVLAAGFRRGSAS